MGVDTLRVMGRATQGVRLISLRKGDEIASIAKVPASDEEEELDGVEGVEAAEGAQDIVASESTEESTGSEE